MTRVFEARNLSKQFGHKTVLDALDLHLDGPAIVGLLGRNACGKTTLMRHIVGQYLPNAGQALTFGTPVERLGHDELRRIGYVPQEVSLLRWMTVEQHLDYVATFYPRWDRTRQDRLIERLELDAGAMVGQLSSGDLQKLAIVLAVCHHPCLLVLDEPVSDLDPISRAQLLRFLLEVLQDDAATILVSSHVLRDVEKIVDHVVCLDRGKVTVDAALDELKETLMVWLVQWPSGTAVERFEESYILEQEISGRQARLVVRCPAERIGDFGRKHGVDVMPRPMNLEDMFPWLLRGTTS